MIKRTPLIALISFCLVTMIYTCVFAQEEKPEEQFVYKMYLNDGNNIIESFIPQNEDTIYILADENNALSARVTLVQWWPISRQYVAIFQQLNEEVHGTLEILKGGKILASNEKGKYLLFYPHGIAAGQGEMQVGKEAYETLKKHKDPLIKYYEKYDEYNLKVVEFQNAFTAYAEELEKKKKAGITITAEEVRANMPRPPEPPEAPGFDITGLRTDFILNLPKGSYTIRLRAQDGTIVEGSEKKLVAFGPRRIGGVGYEIIPKHRWTKRENSNDSSSIIYATGDSTLYVRGFHEIEYNERDYMKLQNPQNQGNAQKWIWFHGKPIKDGLLVLAKNGGAPEKIKDLSYYVKQVPGPTLGYDILPVTETEIPDKKSPAFDGHMVKISPGSADGAYSFWLESPDGKPMQGSERKIIELRDTNTVYLYVISFFPLVLGGFISLRRRRA